ncbi:MAG: flippase-like domain-containing protein [Ignavibacteriales bacterium]|nr:flippase-like domain-containing protein [Ignavibacteriales bacterium]
METGSQALRKWFWRSLRLCVGIVSMYFVFHLVHPQELLEALKSADHRFVLLALALLPLNIVAHGWKWHTMVLTIETKTGFHTSLGSYLYGVSLASITPGDVGEYLGRTTTIATERKLHLVGLVLLDRAQNLLIVAMLGISSLALLFIQPRMFAIALVLLVWMLGCLMYFRLNAAKNIVARIRFLRRAWITDVFEAFEMLPSRTIGLTLILSLAFYGTIILQVYFLMSAFITAKFVDVAIGYLALLFVKALMPISIGDIGIREMSAVYFFSKLGIPSVAAVNVALLVFAMNVVLPAILGVFYMPRLRNSENRETS